MELRRLLRLFVTGLGPEVDKDADGVERRGADADGVDILFLLGDRAGGGNGGVRHCAQALGVLIKRFARLGELDTAACPLNELDLEVRLQSVHLLHHRGRRHVKLLRRLVEAAALGDGDERIELGIEHDKYLLCKMTQSAL